MVLQGGKALDSVRWVRSYTFLLNYFLMLLFQLGPMTYLITPAVKERRSVSPNNPFHLATSWMIGTIRCKSWYRKSAKTYPVGCEPSSSYTGECIPFVPGFETHPEFPALTGGRRSPQSTIEKSTNGSTLPVYNELPSLVLCSKCLW